jgi:hypothetical protein
MEAVIKTHLDHRLLVLGRRETALPFPFVQVSERRSPTPATLSRSVKRKTFGGTSAAYSS